MTSPLIVVGMPRSGSTLLTRILNESPDLFIVNDFYYLQYVDSVNGFTSVDNELSQTLAKEVLDRIKARIERLDSPELECGLYFSESNERELENFVRDNCQKDTFTWSELLEKIMTFSASLIDKKKWGYNTPQDYLHIDRLEKHFPQAKFIYLMRDPRAVLRSYKNVQSNGYHETNRYHPIIQTLAWRTAMQSFLTRKSHNNCILIRYEDLIGNTDRELSRIGQFIGTQFHKIDLSQFGNNSSFKNKVKKSDLSPTEIWLCEQIAGEEMEIIDYSLSGIKPNFKDTFYIAKLSVKVTKFYLYKVLLSSDVRKRTIQVMKKAFARR